MAEFVLDTEPEAPAPVRNLVIAGIDDHARVAHGCGPAEAFFHAYLTTLVWADTTWDTDFGQPPDGFDNQSVEMPPDQLLELAADVVDFITTNSADLAAYATMRHPRRSLAGWRDAGHDFALTRNRHGAGFWDRGLADIGDRLTAAAHAYGPQGLTAWIVDNQIRTSLHG